VEKEEETNGRLDRRRTSLLLANRCSARSEIGKTRVRGGGTRFIAHPLQFLTPCVLTTAPA